MNAHLERLARWYLARRGIVTLPRTFVGLAIGYGQAIKLTSDGDFATYNVEVPAFAKPIILNNSLLIDRS
jgi:hypothetical protein